MAGTVLNMIGLARRAGHVRSGDAAVRSTIVRREARLIILAEDAAERTKKVFGRLAGDAGMPMIFYGTRDNLGRVLGKPSRSVVAITDENFARDIIRRMERGEAN
ncbi:MAG: L7Ae/L30e/S12e/Gadd45 family ribosomal protein [Bacillota bacterium]